MATKKKTTTPTTKTSKRSTTTKKAATAAEKSVKTIKETKTTPKAAEKPKVTVERLTKSPKSANKGALDQLRQLNLIAGFFYVAAAVALWVVAKDYYISMNVQHLAKDTLASSEDVVVQSFALRRLFDINLLSIVVAALVVSAFVRAKFATIRRSVYETGIENGMSKHRWMDILQSACFIVLLSLLAVGVRDLAIVAVTVLLAAVATAFGYIYERAVSEKNGAVKKVSKIAGLLSGLVAVGVPIDYILLSRKYGSVTDVSDNVMAVVVFVLIAFVLVAFFVSRQAKIVATKSYAQSEKTFILASFALKALVVWQIFEAFLRP